ncbi:MAG: hypothetical protein ACYS80_25185 [Planctomycetota bacterium]|jgi:hypothetical protein
MAGISKNVIKSRFLGRLAGISGESLFYVRNPDVSQAQHDKMSQITEHNLKKQSQF